MGPFDYEPKIARGLRAHVHVLDRGTEHWRGGVITAIAGTATLRVLVEANMVRTFSGVALAALPAGAILGDPIVVRVTGGGADTYTIAEVRASHFNADSPGTNQAGAIARGDYHYGVVPRSITGESEFLD